MEHYSIQTWILLFFIYSFLGWVWETCFVSAKERKFVNRGFLYSPILPIYGFGAIVVLISTIEVRDNLYLVYIFGTIGATTLELVTGYIMETLFKTRYWDYSYKKIHYKGYICLSSTLAWGFFSILMTEYINMPVENLVLGFSSVFSEILVLVLVISFTVDVTKSVQNAINLRELLEIMADNNQKVGEFISDIENISERVDENRDEVKAKIKVLSNELKNGEHLFVERVINRKQKDESKLVFSKSTDKLFELVENLEKSLRESENKTNLLSELQMFKDKVHINNIELKQFKGAIGQIKRNESARSLMKDELEKIKHL